ncbi:MAG: VWA domain-containing protein, partial [Henriciella sp.]|uniref:vWA domain-containing protein n=1 Tax=Henriciella sp. TaxID=1968823 RepID=UPI003C73F0CB
MRIILSSLALSSALAIGTPATSFGQDGGAEESAPKDAILVLDASGSMWGQIDGVNKIVIAKDVVEGLVRSLPASQRLGMVAYGHRKKGDCTDIQTMADVGADREAVIKEIRTLSPKGMTPLTKSVEHAANELNYTKNAATVILVSDGLETCEADPCVLARTLEENGLDFTVHVVGFDVTEEERKGLVCIAEETGGQFLAADNADELTDALTQVALTAEPLDTEPSAAQPQTVALRATLLKGGPQIQSKLNWSVENLETGDVVFEADNTGYADFEVVPGEYKATAVWTGWPHEGERVAGDKVGTKDFTIVAARPAVVSVPIELGIPVTLSADESVAEGTQITVNWTGPDDLGATVSVNRVDDDPREAIYFSPAQRARDSYEAEQTKDGESATDLDTNGDGTFDQDDEASTAIGAPSEEGDYEVRYTLNSPRLILMRVPLTVTDGGYALSAPDEVPVSTEFEVTWSGALTSNDVIAIEPPDLSSAYYQGPRAKLTEGEPARITAPSEPGEYEIRYIMFNGYTTYAGMQHAVQVRRPITVTEVEASVSGPAEIVGGSVINVDVVPVPGDDWKDDYV